MIYENGMIINLFKIGKYLQEVTSKACKKMKISHVGLMIIGISATREMNVSQLSQELGITKSAVSQALVCLQVKKLINKVASPDNKKSFYIKPTEKAIELGKEIFDAHMVKFLQIKEELGEEKFLMFFSLVQEINKIIENDK
jgi:bacterial regulatory protein, arsR family